MNIFNVMTYKKDVVYLYEDFSVRQALEKMSHHGIDAAPVITREGCYVGSVTKQSVLKQMRRHKGGLSRSAAEKTPLKSMLNKSVSAVNISTQSAELLIRSCVTPFVPVVDDRNMFIGQVDRNKLINHALDSDKILFRAAAAAVYIISQA